MTLKDVDAIISQLMGIKFADTGDLKSEMFNLGIERAIDVIKNAEVIDAKVKIDKKVYQQNYYQRVTKLKRQQAKENRTESTNENGKEI